jgi:hypothetical protein
VVTTEHEALVALVIAAEWAWAGYLESDGNGKVMTPLMQDLRAAYIEAQRVLEQS